MTEPQPAENPRMLPEDFGIGHLYQRVPDAIVVRDTQRNRIVLWNPAAEAIFGYAEADVLGRGLDLIVPTWPADSRAPVEAHEMQAVHRDGRPMVIELSLSALEPLTVPGDYDLAIIRDVTSRARDRQALRERAELLDVTHDAIFLLDPALRILYWNRGAESTYGWPAGEVVGRVVHELLKTRFPASVSEVLAELERRGVWEGELTHTRRDGTEIIVASRWVLRRDQAGEMVSIMDTNNDITDRKRYEAALQQSEARFKAFMDAGPVLAAIRDEAGRYLYTNAAHRELFGPDAEASVPPEARGAFQADEREGLAPRQLHQIEETVLQGDETRHLLTFNFPFSGLHGDVCFGALSIDITELRQAQAALLHQAEELRRANVQLREADRYKDEFLANLSHELRTPLNFIMGSASLLDEEVVGALNPSQHEFVDKVMLGADRLLVLIDNLLEVTRIAAGKLTLFRSWMPYAALVQQVVSHLGPAAAAKRIALTSVLDVPEEAWLDGDQLKLVLTNLIDNAIKFTEPGGQVEVRAFIEGDRLVTEVADTGIGIAPEAIPKLFRRFEQLDMSATRRAGGLGVGLSLSKALVEAHGGDIAIDSQPGRGTTVRFSVPWKEPERAA